MVLTRTANTPNLKSAKFKCYTALGHTVYEIKQAQRQTHIASAMHSHASLIGGMLPLKTSHTGKWCQLVRLMAKEW